MSIETDRQKSEDPGELLRSLLLNCGKISVRSIFFNNDKIKKFEQKKSGLTEAVVKVQRKRHYR